jgi:hypothetical protein
MGALRQGPGFGQYERVAASATDQVLGAAGASGDFLERLIIIPATTAAGNVTLTDGVTAMSVFVTGTLADLSPIIIECGMRSATGAWKISTGANVSVIAVGKFT